MKFLPNFFRKGQLTKLFFLFPVRHAHLHADPQSTAAPALPVRRDKAFPGHFLCALHLNELLGLL